MRKIIILLLCCVCNNLLIKGQSIIPLVTEKKFNLKNIPSPQGLAWDGNNFWIIDNYTFSLYKLSSDIENVDSSFYIADLDFRALTFDGQNLLAIDNTNQQILKINRNNLYDIKEVKLPIKNFINGITWDGSNIYISFAAGWSSQIAKVISGTDSISFIAYTVGTVTGLTYYNNSFYYSYNNSGMGPPGIISVKQNLEISYSLPNEIMFASGVEIVSGHFWVMDYGNKMLYKLIADSTSTNVISNTVPDKEILAQNYPNPFNPLTIIEYKIKKADYITLRIYNLLGKEIAVLINEYKSAGDYKIEFNADQAGLTSGVYFYVLKVGNHSTIKKMILIK